MSPASETIVSPNDLHLTVPTFSQLRDTLRRKIVSNFWHNSDAEPSRLPYRPSFERKGRGSSLVMPLSASWMSSGPDVPKDESNVVAFPKGVDRTFTDYMKSIGVLGRDAYIDFRDFPVLAQQEGMPIYNVDDLPKAWDAYSAVPASLSRYVNTKKYVTDLTSSPAPYEIVDLRTATAADFDRIGGGKTVYVKLNNTENTGTGVRRCKSAAEFAELVKELRLEAEAHQEGDYALDFDIVVQPSIDGINRSFQCFVTPEEPTHVRALTVSKQFVEDDGVTYNGNENPPIQLEDIDPEVSILMRDMVARIKTIDPQVFGFIMCDFFETPDGRRLAFDPGLRPTGNTATVQARMFIEEVTGQQGYHSHFFFVPSDKPNTPFKDYTRPIDSLMGPDAAVKEKATVLPWGYNQHKGNGLFIAVARTQQQVSALIEETKGVLLRS